MLDNIKNKKLKAANKPKSKCFKLFVLFFGKFFISNIIITNKNNTAIAPTYTIINNKGKNSDCKIKRIPADEKKLITKLITECIGFCNNTTNKELINNNKLKI